MLLIMWITHSLRLLTILRALVKHNYLRITAIIFRAPQKDKVADICTTRDASLVLAPPSLVKTP